MVIRRTITGAVGIVLAVLTVGGTAAAANAASAARPAGTVTTAVDSTVAAVSPGISPAAERIRYIGLFDGYSCPVGRACLAVWDPTATAYKVFDLLHCGTYSLSYWHEMGTMKNNQTGGAAVRLYDGSGGQIGSPYPPTGDTGYYQVSWDAVWKVKPC